MGLRFKTESHGGQRDSSLRERGLLLWGGDGTPFAVNRDSFCRQSGLLSIRQQDNKKTSVQDNNTPHLSSPKDTKTKRRLLWKVFSEKMWEFPGLRFLCIVFLSILIRLLDYKTIYKKLLHIIRSYKNIPLCTPEIIFRDRCLSVFVS
jgi:hypothetical protein